MSAAGILPLEELMSVQPHTSPGVFGVLGFRV